MTRCKGVRRCCAKLMFRQSRLWIRQQGRGKQRPGVGVAGILEKRIRRGFFNLLPEIHNGHVVRQMFDHRKIVADKNHGKAQFFLQR